MSKEYIIFDLDGTIINTVEYMYNIIIYEIKNYTKLREKDILIILNDNNGKGIKDILNILLPNIPSSVRSKIEQNISIHSLTHINSTIFHPGSIELIQNLSKKYKLFLSSGNNKKYIDSVLSIGKIKNCFSQVLGSDTIPKSEKHLEYFKKQIDDKDFYLKSLYIGDGRIDEQNANIKSIDFILLRNIYNKGIIHKYLFSIQNLSELEGFLIQKYPKKITEKVVLSNKYVQILQKDFLDYNMIRSSFLIYGHNKKNTIGTFILPITENKEIIYIKEYRAGPEDFVISFPVGALEDNLSEIENCKKELQEETGYISNDISYLGESIIENNFEGRAVYYVAKNCSKAKDQDLDIGETIEVFKTSVNEFKKMILNGKVNFTKTVYCFLLAESKGYFN